MYNKLKTKEIMEKEPEIALILEVEPGVLDIPTKEGGDKRLKSTIRRDTVLSTLIVWGGTLAICYGLSIMLRTERKRGSRDILDQIVKQSKK